MISNFEPYVLDIRFQIGDVCFILIDMGYLTKSWEAPTWSSNDQIKILYLMIKLIAKF